MHNLRVQCSLNPSSADAAGKSPTVFSNLTHYVGFFAGRRRVQEDLVQHGQHSFFQSLMGATKRRRVSKKASLPQSNKDPPSFHDISVTAVMSSASSGLAPLEKPDYVPAQLRSNFIPAAE